MVKSKRAREAVEAVGSENQNGARRADEPSSKKRKQNDDSADVSSTKKAKKDKKDKKKKGGETRKEKKEKRKDLQDLPEVDEPEEAEEAAAPVKEEKPKNEKNEKNEKKDKKDKKDKAASEDKTGDAETPKKKEKKEKKSKKEKKETDTAPTNGDSKAAAENGNGIDLDESTAKKNDRHIVFVGNLPYTATVASISSHFATLKPVAVRCLTNKFEKDPKVTCKGIAFVEFANVWTQRTCLDKFHHSMFDDKMSAPRKINVELTAGGGGKTQHRQDKIMEKNKKLDENRAKRIEREKTTKAENASASQQHMEDSIHPSRRGRVPGAGY